jgi:PAS domain S-box-containing protein
MAVSLADVRVDLGILVVIGLATAVVVVTLALVRRSIRELAIARSRAEAIVESATDAVIVTAADGRTVKLWNPAAERLYGWAAEEVVDRPLPHHATADDPAREAVLDRVRQGERVAVVTRRRRRDGTEIDVRVRYSALHDEHGKVVELMGLASDVTAEHRATARAALVERLAGVVADLSTDLEVDAVLDRIVAGAMDLLDARGASLVFTAGGVPTVVAATGTLGAPVGHRFDASRMELFAEIPPGRPVVIGDYHDRPWKQEAVGDVGTLVAASVRAGTELLGILAVYHHEAGRDVTPDELEVAALLAEHAGTAYANARSYARVQGVLDAQADGVAVLDTRGRVTRWNAAAAEVSGRGAADALGAELPWPVGTPDEPALVRAGDGRWFELAGTPLPTGEGSVVVLRDVSRHKALEEAKSVFLASTGHELKTPLTVVSGYARLLEQRWDTLTEDERRAGIAAISRKAGALTHTVEQIMLFSVAEAGRHDLRPRPLSLALLVAEAVAGVEATAARHRVVVEVPPDLPDVLGDPHRLPTVVAQLVENAVKYSPDGGTVTVSARACDGEVVVCVADDGIGFEPADADRLFERFARGRTGGAGGVGLGLSIVRTLVEAHGGRVWAEGEPGRGARFSFTVPIAP